MNEIACHTWSFNDLTLPEALGTIARLGFRAVDIGSGAGWNMVNAARSPSATAAEIIGDLRLFNLRLTDLALMFPRISVENDEQRARDVQGFVELLPFASALAGAMDSAPGITLSAGVAHVLADGLLDPAAWARSVEALKSMVTAARDFGLAVSIEPHPDTMAATPEDALRLLDAVPELRLTLDWANLIYRGASHQAIAALLPKTRHIHIRQAAKGTLQTPMERGKIDLRQVLADAQAAGYSGAICIEIIRLTGRHGIAAVNPHREAARLRNALRDARRELRASRSAL